MLEIPASDKSTDRAAHGHADRPLTRLMLVDFRCGETVAQHPEIAPLLKKGWTLRSAVPRIVEGQGTKLLVVLSQPAPVHVPTGDPV